MADTSERISVVMPVHNAMPYLNEAVASIVNQTHTDFEFVIGDDGSNDRSSDVLREWAARDSRIRLLRREQASGPADSANWVVRAAQGDVIVRMDADDVSLSDRIARQLRVLVDHPDAVLVACLCVGIDRTGRIVKGRERHLLSGSGLGAPFSHGSIMFRRAAFDRVGGYRAVCQYWEDLDFFARMGRAGRVMVLPDALYHYRFSETSTRLTSADESVEAGVAFMLRCGDEVAAGRDYEPLVTTHGLHRDLATAGDRRSPRVFLSIASGRVGAGQRAAMIRRLLRRGKVPRTRADLIALIYTIWGSLAPRSLRAVLLRRAKHRDRLAAVDYPDGTPVEWHMRRETSPTGNAATSTIGGDA